MSTKRTSKVKNGILIIAMICCLIVIIGGTYARYTSNGSASGKVEMAKWKIQLNDADISSTSTTLDVIAKTKEGVSNTNVSNGKIAPGQTLVAELEIDPTGSEVAVDYIIEPGNIETTSFDMNSKLSIEKIGAILGDSEEESVMYLDGKYTYFENLSDVLDGKKVKFNIYITWEDGNNVADTANGIDITDIVIPVNVIARQHLESKIQTGTGTIEDVLVTGTVVPGSTVALTSNIDYSVIYESDEAHVINLPDNVTLDLEGNVINSKNYSVVYQGNNLTIKNGTFSTPITHSYGIFIGDERETVNNNIKNVTVEGGINTYNTDVTLENVNVTAHKYYAVWGDENTQITINSGKYTASLDSTALVAMTKVNNNNGSFVIKGGTFITNGKPFCLKGQDKIRPVIYGGTFDCDVSEYVSSGYTCVDNGDGTYTVKAE